MDSPDQPSGPLESRVRQREDVADLGQRALEDVPTDLAVRIAETDVEIIVESLPRVDGDPVQLRRLFRNLLDNAITYSDRETPRISVFADKCGEEWTISVRDRGIGIDPADADRIFQVFDRLHGKSVGGAIAVDSTPGEGSTFSVTLPAPDADTATGPTTDHE